MDLKLVRHNDRWLIHKKDENTNASIGQIRYSAVRNTAFFIFLTEEAWLKIQKIANYKLLTLSKGNLVIRTTIGDRDARLLVRWKRVDDGNEFLKVLIKGNFQDIIYQQKRIARLKYISDYSSAFFIDPSATVSPVILLGCLSPSFFKFP